MKLFETYAFTYDGNSNFVYHYSHARNFLVGTTWRKLDLLFYIARNIFQVYFSYAEVKHRHFLSDSADFRAIK